MSAVASSDVTFVDGWESGDRQSKLRHKVRICDVVFAANGGTANDVPASLFGMTKITEAYCIRAVDGSAALSWVAVMVEADDEGILLGDPEDSTDATRGNAADYTGTVRLKVCGY